MLQRYKVLLNTHCLDVTGYYSSVISFPSSLATGLLLFTAEDHGIPFGSIHREFLTLGYEREARSLCQYGKKDLKTPVNTHVAPREERLSLDGQPSWKEKLALVGTEDLGWEPGTPETRHLFAQFTTSPWASSAKGTASAYSSQWGYSHHRRVVRFGKDHKVGGK